MAAAPAVLPRRAGLQLRVAGLGGTRSVSEGGGFEGALVDFHGCRLLLGCPAGTAEELGQLQRRPSDVHAVLLTCAGTADGLPALLSAAAAERGAAKGEATIPCTSTPRILGTAPVLAALEARMLDLADSRGTLAGGGAGGDASATTGASKPAGGGGVRDDVALMYRDAKAALERADEVSFHEEVRVEGACGPVFVTCSSSGRSLGGVYWSCEALGVRIGMVGTLSATPSFRSPVPAPRSLCTMELANLHALVYCDALSGAAKDETMSGSVIAGTRLLELGKHVAQTVADGDCVLVPYDASAALLPELVESVAEAINRLPQVDAQVPIFVLGAGAQLLRRCGSFAEWAHKDRCARAYLGRSPFLFEALQDARRLFLARAASDLGGSYCEPCVVFAPAGVAETFAQRWAVEAAVAYEKTGARVAAKLLVADAAVHGAAKSGPLARLETIAGASAALESRPTPTQLSRLLRDAKPTALVASPAILSAVGCDEAAAAPSGSTAQRHTLARGTLLRVPLDLDRPCYSCWIAERDIEHLGGESKAAKAKGQLKRSGGDQSSEHLRPVGGVLVGLKRPRLRALGAPDTHADMPAAPPLFVGGIDVEKFVAALRSRGASDAQISSSAEAAVQPEARTCTVAIPSMEASVTLNCRVGGEETCSSSATTKADSSVPATALETVIEAPTWKSREFLAEVAESMLRRM
eukprot:TRINITY_DN32662_c0_g1_i1.p1 TRINITY_DN32662_c0_g1~~TRINITY_DN32662_c0_g1_i1.p1  ORF type:complete len:697 (-),score=145.13 TRINITY_DN32662_c0_g1_i1:74-2164(-)